jgi:transposase-like protein
MGDDTAKTELVPLERKMTTTDMARLAEDLVASAAGQGVQLTGDGGLLTALTRQVLQTALEVEMSQHLGYDRGDPAARGAPNIRNGATPKTIRTEIGEVIIDVPRDRAGTFEPQIVPKHQRRIAGFDEAVISLYAKGMTTGDIVAHLADVYDTDISRDLVSRVTDQVLVDMRAWQSRPLDSVYPVILIDAIVLKIRSNAASSSGAAAVGNRPVYVAMGISIDGERDVLGMWVGPTGGEGAKQWMNMLTELRNRGVNDVCIVCCDGLRGLPDAIVATWPKASVQTCVVHLVRNTLRYASQRYWPALTKEMRAIYTAPTLGAAESAFSEFAQKWGPMYPAMVEMWQRSWNEFIPFLEFPSEVRRIIYTTNGIESLNARFRSATRRRGHFPDEPSALKVLYLAAKTYQKNRPNPTGQVNGWKKILNVLSLTFGDRLGLN